MLRDITLGQYYPAESVIHKLDPRVKLFATLIYIISLFCFKGIAALVVATIFLFAVIKASKVPFKFMVKGLKAIMVLMLVTVDLLHWNEVLMKIGCNVIVMILNYFGSKLFVFRKSSSKGVAIHDRSN